MPAVPPGPVIDAALSRRRRSVRSGSTWRSQPGSHGAPRWPSRPREGRDHRHVVGRDPGAMACLRDPRLAAGLLMDVWVPDDAVAAGLRQPVMWMSRDAATMRREGWDDEQIGVIHSS